MVEYGVAFAGKFDEIPMLLLIGGELGHLCLGNDEVEAVVAVTGAPFAQLHTGGSASPLIHAVRGVGGIDSWGSDVEDDYRINAEKDIHYSFIIR